MKRNLTAVSIAAMLASVHYGIGFILGTGEKAYIFGAAGSLYAVSCGLGLIAMAFFARFYWQKREPLWTLLGDRYGQRVRGPVIFLSWAWMIGIVASQVLGGAFIVGTLGFSPMSALFLLALIITLVSLMPVERAAALFQALIVASSLALLYALTLVSGPEEYLRSVQDFVPALGQISWGEVVGVLLGTVLITVLGMDFHQFVVQAQSVKEAWIGCILSGSVLLILAFLPSSVVIGANERGVIPIDIDGKQAIPIILLWIGQQTDRGIGSALVFLLLIAAIGSGAGVLRIMNQTILDAFGLTGNIRRNWLAAVGNMVLILLVALSGRILINLIVSFYAIYIAGVLLPVIVFILEDRGKKIVSSVSIYLALLFGGGAAIAFLIFSRLLPHLFDSNELVILSVGVTCSTVGLLLGKVLQARKSV